MLREGDRLPDALARFLLPGRRNRFQCIAFQQERIGALKGAASWEGQLTVAKQERLFRLCLQKANAAIVNKGNLLYIWNTLGVRKENIDCLFMVSLGALHISEFFSHCSTVCIIGKECHRKFCLMLRFRRHLCEQVLYDLLDAFTANTILQLDQIRNTRCGRIQGPDRILHLAGSLPELGHSLLFAAEQPYHAG